MTVNLQRRKSVMARSIKLGHCVCNPRNPCPCDTFKQYNVCPCAGERLPVQAGPIALTKHVSKPGCASKIGQGDLARILSHLPPVSDPNILVGTAAGDDAGVYRISETQALVQTVDVFTPVVDDPYLFGQIAAANSLSDVYAMGGRPLTALSIIGFPIDELDGSIMEAILAGGIDKLNEAGCALVGGHSIADEEIKCGFSITGMIDPKRVVERNHARAGDVLILTKPLGSGMISFGAQIGRIGSDALNEAGAWMAQLNRDAAELMVRFDASACTDVTGFGLAGHLVEMAKRSGVVAEVEIEKLPVFAAAAYCLENEILPGAIERNEEYAMGWIRVDERVPASALPLIYDPQTSGGLLIAFPEKNAEAFVNALRELGNSVATVIGKLLPTTEEGHLFITGGNFRNVIGSYQEENMSEPKENTPQQSQPELSCCDQPGGAEASAGADFGAYLKAANEPGLIDKRAKKLMAIALSVAQRCRPCLATHMRSALAAGITKAEIDEAANLAVAFAGCPALMMYKEVCREVGV
jgi:selenide, water dikinase